MSRSKTTPDDYSDAPLYWFAILDQAVEHGDYAKAADAQRELERLGVRVRYSRPRQRREEADASR